MPAVTFEKLYQSLTEKKFQPLYFLHGPESYFIDQITDFIAENALSESEKGFNQVILYGKDTDANTIKNTCARYPLMSAYQVVIVKEAQNLKSLPALESYFEHPVPTTILVMAHKYKSMDKRLKVTKLLEKNALLFESKKIAENKVPDWIEKAVGAKGHKIAPKAAFLLSEYLGNDLEQLSNAIEKLTISAEPGQAITEKDIESNIGISREYNVFELTNALGARDMPKIAKLVNYINSTPKENPLPMIIGVLYNYFSKLTSIYISGRSDKESLKSLGVMEWFQKDFLKAAQAYGPRLKHIMKMIEEYDLRFKGVNDTGTADTELLKELVYRIALPAK